MEQNRLVEILYSYTRRAGLTAEQHEECRSIAQQLLEKFRECCPEGKCKKSCKEKVEE